MRGLGPPVPDAALTNRFLLAALALCAQGLWYLLTAGPVAAMLAFGLLWVGAPPLWAAVVGVAGFVFFSWLASPNATPPSGNVVDESQAPKLFEALARMRAKLDVAGLRRVVLTDELNAAAYQSGRAGLPWRMSQTLVLGIPLLAVLRPNEAEAVIAHELGHFSRRHGLFGHWVYRARLSWLHLARGSDSYNSAFDRAIAQFAQRFAPWFGEKAFAFSRQCEYEADGDAAQASSGVCLIQALQTLDVGQQRLARWHEQPEQQVQRLESQAPTDAWSLRLLSLSREAFSSDELNLARGQSASNTDTHPSLKQRASALNVPWLALSDRIPSMAESAGALWFGAQWPELLAQGDRRWRADHQLHWRADSFHLAALQQRLQSDDSADWMQSLWRLHALDRFTAARELAQVRSIALEHAPIGIAFLVWSARLSAGDAAAAAEIEALVTKEPALALPAREALLNWAHTQGSPHQIAKNEALCERAAARRSEAVSRTHELIEQSGLLAPDWPDGAVEAFAAQAQSDACVQALWMGQGDVSTTDNRRFHAKALVVQIDPDRMRADSDDEDGIRDRYARQLKRWRAGPHQLAVVRTLFTTERALPVALGRSEAKVWQRA